MIIKSDETLDLNNLKSVLGGIYLNDEGVYSSYNRFADLSRIENIEVDFDSIVSYIRTYRGINPPENDIKVAVYIPYGVTHSLAKTYGLLAEDETFKIEILSSISKCADYLDVERSVLQ